MLEYLKDVDLKNTLKKKKEVDSVVSVLKLIRCDLCMEYLTKIAMC